MAHVRKVKLPSGLIRWRAVWKDGTGAATSKNFPAQGAAKQHLLSVGGVRGSSTVTVLELARAHATHFDALIKSGIREEITLAGYTSVLDTHIKGAPIAKTRLCNLRTSDLQAFLDGILAKTGSVHTTRKVRRTLSTWCEFGLRKDWLTVNPAKPCKVESSERTEEDERVTIPSKAALSALLAAADTPRDAAVIRLLMFGGLRISELLGLSDEAVELRAKPATVKVSERLDSRYEKLGPPKSAKSRREVPIGADTVQAVRTWRAARGTTGSFLHTNSRGETRRCSGRLFPNPRGEPVWSYQDFKRDCWIPLMERAGLLERMRDAKQIKRPVGEFGPHTLRHVAVSLWIEQGLKPKKVQKLAGHTRIQITMDLYGHLWRDDDADEELAAASERLISGKAI